MPNLAQKLALLVTDSAGAALFPLSLQDKWPSPHRRLAILKQDCLSRLEKFDSVNWLNADEPKAFICNMAYLREIFAS